MSNLPIKLSLFINYFLFAILLNSVGTVILQVQNSYGVTESAASVLEGFKDLSIALTSFLVASFIARIGYKRSMLFALGFIGLVCLLMPQVPAFWMTKLLFAAIGVSFALVKVSVFATLGLVTGSRREHVSTMNFLESFFMVGVMSGYFIFSAFIDDADPGAERWLQVYYLLAVLAFAALALLLFAPLDEAGVTPEAGRPLRREFTDMMALAIKPLVLVFVISAFLYVLIEQSIMSWLPTFNSSILNLSTSLSIQMASILAAATACGRFAAGVVLRRYHWFGVLAVGLALAAALVLVSLPLAGNSGGAPVTSWFDAPLASFVFPLIGLCIAPVYPAINSVILSALPVHKHAPMSGLIVVFSALGGTTGSLVTGHLFEAFGGKTAFYFSLLPIALLLFALYLFKRQTDDVPNG
ncbi:MFS transporter [Exilibacterium tricleocarpae]|uniref:MFS transporter n=1 Tax=Exilibacterium tricleocarpae TaxID=2591008 RepID=A0A545TV27_9GAMM|nr:MFS transporter [Exilibacterium tricleocarpae]TQV81011.1 MFS transporter [Exilibacterium tricleocarpae]